ncbi:hypothetical protein ACFXKW_21025 [Streptomyces sp. NPDC059193]|uniref:hypothetical protein n=1 Tax=Streptomyces sp. NPDC059193 TaxID=3346763 RepID=UPI00369D1D6C
MADMHPQARKALGVALAVLLAGGGFAAGAATAGTSSETETSGTAAPAATTPAPSGSASAPAAAPGASRTVSGIPVGYPQTRSGALSAAANHMAALSSPAILTPDGRATVTETVAASASHQTVRARLDKADSAALDALRADQSGRIPFVLRTIPLSVKESAYSDTAATVSLFTLTVMGSSNSTANSAYGAATVELVWEAGDWKVKAYDTAPVVGPIPAGFYAPSTGWQPSNGKSLYDVSADVREWMNGTVPGYVVP